MPSPSNTEIAERLRDWIKSDSDPWERDELLRLAAERLEKLERLHRGDIERIHEMDAWIEDFTLSDSDRQRLREIADDVQAAFGGNEVSSVIFLRELAERGERE